MSDFPNQIDALAGRVLKELKPDAPATAWEMKLKLKVPLSVLYMALGQLMKDELVRVAPEGLSYRIHLLPKQSADVPLIVPNLTAAELPSDAPNAEVAPQTAAEAPAKTVAKTVLGLAEVLEANGVLGDPELSTNQ